MRSAQVDAGRRYGFGCTPAPRPPIEVVVLPLGCRDAIEPRLSPSYPGGSPPYGGGRRGHLWTR
jgi:hypothetical protein